MVTLAIIVAITRSKFLQFHLFRLCRVTPLLIHR